MSDLIPKSKVSKLAWTMVVAYVILFSIGALSTCATAALTGKQWGDMTSTDHLVIVLAILSNWTIAMKDFIRQALEKMSAYVSKPEEKQTTEPNKP